MRSPRYLTDFDSSTALVRALGCALHEQPFRHLGSGPVMGALVRAAGILPKQLAANSFSVGGAAVAIRARQLRRVSAQRFAQWTVDCYPRRPVGAIAIGSSNGAVMHLAAALGSPWLPQTFLTTVRRRSRPDDPTADVELGRRVVPPLLERERDLQIHQMHDPNQDRLMLERLAYLRITLRRLPVAYRSYIRSVLPPGGTIVVVDCTLRWPVVHLGERHVFQIGAVGGLAPSDYADRWSYPEPDGDAPEAEWGLETELTEDVLRLAREDGYRVVRLSFDHPDAPGPFVADAYRRWYADEGFPVDRLLVETFINVEPYWALATRTVPLWTTFPVQHSLRAATDYLDSVSEWREIAVTLFAHGTSSEGLAPANAWQRLAGRASRRGTLPGIDLRRWPTDLASLDRYAPALRRDRSPALMPRRSIPWSTVREALASHSAVAVEELT